MKRSKLRYRNGTSDLTDIAFIAGAFRNIPVEFFFRHGYARRLLSSQSEEVIMNFTAALKALSRASDENNTVEHNIR